VLCIVCNVHGERKKGQERGERVDMEEKEEEEEEKEEEEEEEGNKGGMRRFGKTRKRNAYSEGYRVRIG
jgi:hypothetical protein